MKFFYLLLSTHCVLPAVLSQNVAINNEGSQPHASAMLDIQSSTKGMLIPRLSTGERTAIANPASGLTIYNTNSKRFEVFNNGWSALQPELPPGTSVISDSITNAPLTALGFTYAGYFDQHFALPPQSVTISGNGWFKINTSTDNNDGAPYSPPDPDLPEPDMTGDLVVNTNDQFVYFKGDSVFQFSPATNSWTSYPVEGNRCRYGVWTGTEVLGWNGYDTIFKYDPVSHTLTRLRHPPVLSMRIGFSVVWTGTEMIVWGGKAPASETYYATGAAFNPATNSWTLLSPTSFPGRAWHSAIWTGTQMVIHGGESSVSTTILLQNSHDIFSPPYEKEYDSFQVFRSTIRYTRSTNTWGNPINQFTARSRHSAVWTGTEMIVYGGLGYTYVFDYDFYGNLTMYEIVVFNSGFRQNFSTNTSVSFTGTRSRYQHTAVWEGNDMRLIGGYTGKKVEIGPAEYPMPAPTGKEVCEWAEVYRPNPGIWGIASRIPGGVVKNFVPYAFFQDGKTYAFGQTSNSREQGYVRSFTSTNVLQAVPPVSKRMYLFKKNQ